MQDAWVFEHAVECPVPREFAWSFWTTVENWKLDADVETVELRGPFVSGSEGTTISRSSGRIEWRLADVNPGNSAVCEFPLPGATARFLWTFEDVGGRTRITQRASLAGENAASFFDGMSALEKGIPAGMQKLSDSMAQAAGGATK